MTIETLKNDPDFEILARDLAKAGRTKLDISQLLIAGYRLFDKVDKLAKKHKLSNKLVSRIVAETAKSKI